MEIRHNKHAMSLRIMLQAYVPQSTSNLETDAYYPYLRYSADGAPEELFLEALHVRSDVPHRYDHVRA